MHSPSPLVALVVVVTCAIACGGRPPVPPEPSNAPLLVARGLERALKGDYHGAIEEYDRAIRVEPTSVEAYINRGFARLALGDSAGSLADFREASRRRNDAWSLEIAARPADVRVLLRRGVASADLAEYRAAIEDYDKVLQLAPTNAEAHYLRGTARYRLGDQSGAMTDYDAALQLNPDLVPAYVARAAVHKVLGNAAAAAADYASARYRTSDDQVH